jgi:hypothetical protein
MQFTLVLIALASIVPFATPSTIPQLEARNGIGEAYSETKPSSGGSGIGTAYSATRQTYTKKYAEGGERCGYGRYPTHCIRGYTCSSSTHRCVHIRRVYY